MLIVASSSCLKPTDKLFLFACNIYMLKFIDERNFRLYSNSSGETTDTIKTYECTVLHHVSIQIAINIDHACHSRCAISATLSLVFKKFQSDINPYRENIVI
jgi:hypothetical protein